jgi:hypothetical protein
MKKQFVKKFFAPIGKGIAVFAVFGFALYAYAAITYPPEPGPVTGVVGQFIGLSETNYTSGNGYNSANAQCPTGSHICTAMEIINTYNNNPTAFNGLTGPDVRGWINNGPPGYLATPANDCNGWQTTSGTKYGSIWIFNLDAQPSGAKQALLQTCNNSYPFACCK